MKSPGRNPRGRAAILRMWTREETNQRNGARRDKDELGATNLSPINVLYNRDAFKGVS